MESYRCIPTGLGIHGHCSPAVRMGINTRPGPSIPKTLHVNNLHSLSKPTWQAHKKPRMPFKIHAHYSTTQHIALSQLHHHYLKPPCLHKTWPPCGPRARSPSCAHTPASSCPYSRLRQHRGPPPQLPGTVPHTCLCLGPPPAPLPSCHAPRPSLEHLTMPACCSAPISFLQHK